MDPGSSPGVTGAERPRIRPALFPSFLRKQSLPRSAVLPYSVIPAKAGIHVHRNETAEALPEGPEDPPEGAKYLRPPSALQHGPRVYGPGWRAL